MKKYSWIFVILGVAALGLALVFGAAFGAGITYFLLQADPVQAAFFAPGEVNKDEGVLIAAVEPGSPAAESGLVRGDIILEVNGTAVNNLLDLQNILGDLDPGESVELTVLHGDETRTLEAQLGDNGGLAYLGINVCNAPMSGTMMFDRPQGDFNIEVLGAGAKITEVIEGSPAEAAGLLVGDLILSVEGEKIGPETSLATLIQAHKPGDTVTLEIQSEGTEESHEIEVTLGENPDVADQAYLGIGYQPIAGFHRLPKDFNPEDLPFWFDPNNQMPEDFNPENELPFLHPEIPQLPEGLDSAVIVGEIMTDSPAEKAGLQAQDIILSVDGEPLTAPDAFAKTIQAHQPGDEVTLTIYRDGEKMDLAVVLAENPDNAGAGYLGVLVGFLQLENLEQFEGTPQDRPKELPDVPGGDA